LVAKTRVPKTKPLLKLDLGCGQNCTPGFSGVDLKKCEGVTHVTDLFQAPWPFGTNSVAETTCNHVVEHIPHCRPQYEGVDGWWVFFNELWRVCGPDARCVFTHPYAKHDRAFWDPTHTRYIPETTWYYLDKQWRAAQRLDHYDATCDFEVISIQGVGVDANVTTRSHEVQADWRAHRWNVIPDLLVELKARK